MQLGNLASSNSLGQTGAMVAALFGAGPLLALGVLLWLARRAAELACFRVRDGRLVLHRGRVPPRLLGELQALFDGRTAEGLELRLVLDGGEPRVRGKGLDEGDLQRVRNVVGQFRTAELRQGRVRSR
jgi:hypothetical protein